ncbi:hypothetical protein NCU01860 [Neurospora crassa OR74A]|uniref:ATP-grasp domain-containing protein n=1 Tax=Neurospora crassa (strain ATCC 24698 / 74-OR23-1A / CBS 708.71 / DSM 1257 / FGSC 987) TaxID=367110 RepID=Q7SHE6_NEUCR|nr:hypothetical protein NCU01860 [Neurospora crassa OR74A]EAA36255.2 hypothetical protein NCU01860 [Neurospora crassa OR74A]|eukprot:XP_965491.2 hypothetical protein NCU01860 [Neurospora crassa OR74A]
MGSATINLPTIHLDTTLTDLYKLADPSTAHLRLGFVLCGVNSAIALTPSFPRNKKYLYQDSPFNNIPPAELKDAAASSTTTELQRSIALKYLSLIPQRDAFITGGPHTPTIFFNVSPGSALQEAHDRHEAEATIAVLSPEQRPKLVFCSGPAEIPVKELGIDRLAVKIMLDDLEKKGYPLVVNQETQWFLNSKAGLAESGLPTPRAEVVDVEGFVPPLAGGECCEVCRAEDDVVGKGGMRFVPAGCKGARGQWLEEQMKRIVEKVDARQAPFVFKTQQTFGGAGTWVVSDEEKKRELVKKLMDDETGVLRKLLSQVTAKNQQLKPGSVVLSEMVRDPVGDYGVTFLVRKGGEATFLAASEQMINEDNAWIGSTINYARQDRLKEKFEGIMRQTAEWVGKHGYIGPVGIDVLETKDIPKDELVQGNGISSADGEKTAQYIVDLNVRTSGSLALPLLKGHFTSRGMTCASSFSTTLRGSRKQFMETWREEFETGRMLIMAWYEDDIGNEEKEVESIGDVVVGGKDEKDLQDLMKRVRESTEEVTF